MLEDRRAERQQRPALEVGEMQRQVYFVGTESEVSHHAAPLMNETSFCTSVIDAVQVVETANAGDIAIFFSEHFDRFRQAIVELKEKRVATIYLVDGILEWRNAWENSNEEPACPFTMRPVLSDKVAVIGPSQARVLSCWGNTKKIETVGIPRLDFWTDHWRNVDHRQVDRQSDHFRVLISTAKTPGFTSEQILKVTPSLDSLSCIFTTLLYSGVC